MTATPVIWGVDYASVDDGGKAETKPDLVRLKAAGCDFVWLRATYNGAVDMSFVRDWAALAAAEFTRGAYMFPVLSSKLDAKAQVKAFAATVKAAGGLRPGVDFPPCLDVEFPKGIAGTGLDRAGVLTWIREAVVMLRAEFACWPVIYTSGRVWNDTDTDCLGNPAAPDLVQCPLWLARYAYKTRVPAMLPPPVVEKLPVPTPWGDFWIAHQDQGDALGVPGLHGTADVDRYRAARRGDHGGHVKYVQSKLAIADDGVFGAVTEAAVKAWQAEFELPATGAVDPRTFNSIAWR